MSGISGDVPRPIGRAAGDTPAFGQPAVNDAAPAPAARPAAAAGSTYTAATVADARPPAIERVQLESRTEAVTAQHYLAVSDGRIWVRPNEETTGKREPWRLLDGSGLPQRSGIGSLGFDMPAGVKEISADGPNLIAISDTGRIYYAKLDELKWKDDWGMPAREVHLPPNRAWAISNRKEYTDAAGRRHVGDFGVTTLYALDPDGKTIRYADPWLPDFKNELSGPLRGRFVAENLAAAGSTMFVVNKFGDMYTRLADFDTVGDDWLLPMTYDAAEPSQMRTKRVIPGEEWVRQPKVPGKITSNITIVQTGDGHQDRELRVEGRDDAGRGGFWRKPIQGGDWSFVRTGDTPRAPLLDNKRGDTSALTCTPPLDRDYARGAFGRSADELASLGASIALRDFHPRNTPATIKLSIGGETFDVKLHLRRFFSTNMLVGTIELPEALLKSKDPRHREVVERAFGGEQWNEVQVETDGRSVRLHDRSIPMPAGLRLPTPLGKVDLRFTE